MGAQHFGQPHLCTPGGSGLCSHAQSHRGPADAPPPARACTGETCCSGQDEVMTAQHVTWYAARGMSSQLLLLLLVPLQPRCCGIFTTGECHPAKRRHLPSANTYVPATMCNIAGDDCCVCSTSLAPAGGQRGTKQLSATCVSCWKIASRHLCDVAQGRAAKSHQPGSKDLSRS